MKNNKPIKIKGGQNKRNTTDPNVVPNYDEIQLFN